MDKIKLFKNNTPFKERNDDEWVVEFFNFLQGEIPEKISIPDEDKVKLTPEQAYSVVWYLKEHFSILPDNMFKCDVCQELFNEDNSGYYSEKGDESGNHHFCGGCDHLVPYDYE